jgi:hypothetical protein
MIQYVQNWLQPSCILISARTPARRLQEQRTLLLFSSLGRLLRHAAVRAQIFLNNIGDVLLAAVFDSQVDRGIGRHAFRVGPYIAADGHNDSFRIAFFCAVQHLSAFTVCDTRDCAGVDDIDIGLLIKRYNNKAFFL